MKADEEIEVRSHPEGGEQRGFAPSERAGTMRKRRTADDPAGGNASQGMADGRWHLLL
jgi:hypothetical protein